MNYEELLDKITPEIYENLRKAIEIGRWPDGRTLTAQQKEDTMSAIIAYDKRHLPEQERTGFIDKGHKEGDLCDDDVQPLSFKE